MMALYSFKSETEKKSDESEKTNVAEFPVTKLKDTESDNIKNTEEFDKIAIIADAKANSTRNKIFETAQLLPSEVKDRNYLYFSTLEDKPEESERGGKWMIYTSGDLEMLNYAWVVLQRLCHEGVLLAIKSSTSTDVVKGVVMCYTSDSENRKEVKKAADEIRKLIDFEYILYYKATSSPLWSEFGYVERYKYMHTVKGDLYEIDLLKRWKCISSLEDNFGRKKDFNYEQLTKTGSGIFSRNEKTALSWRDPSFCCNRIPNEKGTILNRKRQNAFEGSWSLVCDSKIIISEGHTEMQKISGLIMELFDERREIFSKSPQYFEISGRGFVLCCTANSKDKENVLKAANAIRKKLHNFPFALFYSVDKRITYMNSCDGDLYEKTTQGTWKVVNVC